MSVLDFAALDSTALQHEPFDHVIVPDFVKPNVLESVNRDYPDIQNPGNFAPERLSYGPAFEGLLNELNSAEAAKHFTDKFGVDVTASPTTITIRKYCELSDGDIHPDHWSKIITVLIYFNTDWRQEGGRLRLLRSTDDIEDYAVEVPPVAGTMLAFRCSDHSFHGHKRFEGERRFIQMSWLRPSLVARFSQALNRLATHTMKRLSRTM